MNKNRIINILLGFVILMLLQLPSVAAASTETDADTVTIEQISDVSVRVEGKLSKKGEVTLSVFRPGFGVSDIEFCNPAANIAALAYYTQFETYPDGTFSKEIKIDGASGVYTACFGGVAQSVDDVSFVFLTESRQSTVFNLDFEDSAQLMYGWSSYSLGGATFKVVENAGSNRIAVTSGGTGYTSFRKNLTAPVNNGVYKLSFEFSNTELGNNSYVIANDSQNNSAMLFAFKSGGVMGMMQELVEYTPAVSENYTSGTVYSNDIYLDLDTRCAYWCRGEELLYKTVINEAFQDISNIQIHVNGLKGTSYIDNVKLTQVTESGFDLPKALKYQLWGDIYTGIKGNITASENGKTAIRFFGGARYKMSGEGFVVDAKVFDYSGNLVADTETEIVLNGNSFEKQLEFELPYGCYKIEITAMGSGEAVVLETEKEFSVANLSSDLPVNAKLGAATHIVNLDNPDSVLDILDGFGAGLYRDEVRWSDYELTKGVYTMPERMTKLLNRAKTEGADVMLILGNSNNLYENTYPPTTADALKAFGAYCYDIAHKTKDTVFYFEVWNEFNLAKETKGFTPETYANILKVAYENVKAANPKAKVFLGGLGRVYGNEGHLDEDYVWLNSLFDKIAANDVKFDGVTIHPYRFLSPEEGEFVEQIQDFKNYLTAKGYGDKMLWISEMGWPSFNDPSWMQITEKQQAEYLVRMLALNEANSLAERVIWYCDRDYGINPVDQEQNFGLIKATAYETPYAAKPSYVAMAQYNKFFGTAENVSRRIVGQNVSVVSGYNPNGERVSVIWKAEGKETVTLTMPANSTLSVFDIYGNQLPVTVEDLSYTIEVSESPIYVKNTFEMLYYEVNGSQVCVSATIDKERFSSATLCVVTYNKATGVMTSVKCSDKFVLADGLYTANVSVEPETDEVVKAILLESVESLASLTTHLYID